MILFDQNRRGETDFISRVYFLKNVIIHCDLEL